MNRENVFETLKEDEGVENRIYKDHLGYPTFGVGHLITKDDPEFGKPVDTEVSEERVWEAFEQDLDVAVDECEVLFEEEWHKFPGEVQEIVVNMMFNMGRPRLSKFKGMKRGVDSKDWNAAADEMVDSNWYRQVTKRADRLVARMRAVQIDD